MKKIDLQGQRKLEPANSVFLEIVLTFSAVLFEYAVKKLYHKILSLLQKYLIRKQYIYQKIQDSAKIIKFLDVTFYKIL